MKFLFLALNILTSSWIVAQNALIVPELVSGENISLTLQQGTHEFVPGQLSNSMGANGNVLGPTIVLDQGQQVNFSVENQIGETTTVHWHGMHVAPENDGGPHTTIADGATWNPSFEVMDRASTFWYHPHLHEHTDEHVSKGIAGMIIVRDDEEALLDLPRTYGVDDIPLVIQTKDFDASGEIVSHSNSDDIVLVNATYEPYQSVPAQVIRLRMLNGSSQRVFELGMDNGIAMQQIGSDGGLLSAPISLSRLRLAPGERAEILVDLSAFEGQSVHLNSYASELPNGIYGAGTPGMMAMLTLDGYNPNALNGNDFEILELQVGQPTVDALTSIPGSLVAVSPLLETSADITRSITFSPQSQGPGQLNGNFLFNGSSFNMSTIDYEIPLGNVEVWELTNQTGISHPFHIHDVQFYILDINGATPPANMQGLKDVVLVPQMGNVRFITVFEDFANEDVPYMYHCHMLAHEDAGMMGQFLVVDQANSLEDSWMNNLTFGPNPVSELLRIQNKENGSIEQVTISDASGRIILQLRPNDQVVEIRTEDWKSGSYIAEVRTSSGAARIKFMKH